MTKPKEPTALVVVDMQPGYLCQNRNRKRIIKNVAHLVKGAKRDQVPIIFLELFPTKVKGGGPTYPELTQITQRFKKCRVVEKNRADGSAEVRRACKTLKITPKHFVVCGVYFMGCVKRTVDGLHQKFGDARISVVKNATDYRPSNLKYEDVQIVYNQDRIKLINLGQKG